MATSDYTVTGGLRVECATASDATFEWTYVIVEYGPERRLAWWLVNGYLTPRRPVGEPVRLILPRVGNMGATPVTAREAEIVLGWPPSGWESPENPCFDALRELVHAAS